MGGNAIKRCVRKSAADYHKISNQALADFRSKASSLGILIVGSVIKSYNHKPDFGDIDIVYAVRDPSTLDRLLSDQSLLELSSTDSTQTPEFIRNGSVISLLYREMQLDLIRVDWSEYNFAVGYFGYNDLGNLIGKVAHQFGLKFGHRGLTLPVREPNNHVHGEIIVTLDFPLALEFLGFDVARYNQGFDTLEQIFEYVVGSKYFTKSPYAFENVNAVARIRDKKRSTYTKFLDYLETHNPPDNTTFDKPKQMWLPKIFSSFPIATQFERLLHESAYNRAVKQKLTEAGLYECVRQLPPKQAGSVIYQFKAIYTNPVIYLMDLFDLQQAVQQYFDPYLNPKIA